MTDMTKVTVQVAGMFLVIGLILFVAAGTIQWPAAWIFLILFATFTVVLTRWLIRHNPGLLNERMSGVSNANQKTWDKLFYVGVNVLFLGWLILMAFDAVRFGWSNVPIWLQIVGAIMLLVSFYLFFLTFRENSFLSQAVRIQSEREHTVITTGPYRYVRHPMYATAILFLVGASLLLGSWYGVIVALIIILAVAARAVQEERTLAVELPGYANYLTHVKYRLIPYVW